MVSFRFFACPIFVIHNLPREQLGNGAMEAGGGGAGKKKERLKVPSAYFRMSCKQRKKKEKNEETGPRR